MTDFWVHPEYGTIYGPRQETPIGRGCWPALQSPKKGRAFKEGEKAVDRYEMTLLIEKSHPKTKTFLKAIEKLAKEMSAEYNKGKKTKVSVESILQDGDSFDMEKYPYYKNCYMLVARNAKQPQVTDRDNDDLPFAEVKGGMKVRFLVTPLFTSHGLSFKLELVQMVKDDGVRFGGGQRDLKEFLSAIDDSDDEDSEDSDDSETEPEEEEEEESEDEEEEEEVKKPAKNAKSSTVKTGRGKEAVSRLV